MIEALKGICLNHYYISGGTALSALIIGLFIFFYNPKSSINRVFLFMVIGFFGWYAGNAFDMFFYDNPDLNVLWFRIAYSAVPFISITYYHLYLVITGKRSKFLYFLYFLTIPELVYIWFTPFLDRGVYFLPCVGGIWDGAPPNRYFFAYGAGKYLFLASLSATLFFRAYREEADPVKKRQYRFFSILIYIMNGAFIEWLAAFSIPLHVGWVCIPPFLATFGYGVVRHHIMDVRVVITRTGLFLGVYALLLGIPFYVGYQTRAWVLSAFLLAAFASAAPFVFRYLQHKADSFMFQKSRQYQRILKESSRDIVTIKDRDDLIEQTCTLIFDNIKPSFGAFYILEEDAYVLKKSKPQVDFLPSRIERSHPLIAKMSKHEEAVFNYPLEDKEIALILPLGSAPLVQGFLFLGEKSSKEIYSTEDIEAISTLLNQVLLALENIRHIQDAVEEQAEKNRLKKEMEMARQIQASLLPRTMPLVENMTIEGLLLPAKEVAGDYYDFITYSPQKLGIVVADVSGKGMDSGMVMSMTKSTLVPLTEQDLTPRELVIKLNRFLCKQLNQQKFISLIYAEYTSSDSTFTWAGAGHEHVIVYRAPQAQEKPKVEVIKTGGIVLGMFEDIDDKIPQQRITLNRGDRVVLYTDGATEVRNEEDDMFSLKRLVESVRQAPPLSPEGLLNYIKQSIEQFMQDTPQYDDITLVVLGRE